MMRSAGALVLVLHAHLPWVRHPELPFYMEEHWLYEAVAETYLPLIQALRALEADGVPARLTVDVSPTVGAMLDDALLQERTLGYFDNLLALVAKEKRRTAGDEGLHPVVLFYEERLEGAALALPAARAEYSGRTGPSRTGRHARVGHLRGNPPPAADAHGAPRTGAGSRAHGRA
ncbi:MAG: hypothetical protein Q9Q13_08640 [Acidobacteriota bacterium]|nr:hypothetical protein [Acidobacteriota bacterium]